MTEERKHEVGVVYGRSKLLEHMNEIVKSLNNEEAYYDRWILVVPDEADHDDFEYIAEDDDLYKEVCELFRNLIKCYGKDGFYVAEDRRAY